MLVVPPHDHQWVSERLALGSAITQSVHVEHLRQERVTHVLDCRLNNPHPALWHNSSIVYRQAGTSDDRKRKGPEWFHAGAEFVLKALADPRARVLVFCLVGVSRSPSMVFSILRLQGESAVNAEARIRAARPLVLRITYQQDAERAVRAWPRRRRV
jgi:hypothetical protein